MHFAEDLIQLWFSISDVQTNMVSDSWFGGACVCVLEYGFKVDRVWHRGLEALKQQMKGLALAYNIRQYGYLARG